MGAVPSPFGLSSSKSSPVSQRNASEHPYSILFVGGAIIL